MAHFDLLLVHVVGEVRNDDLVSDVHLSCDSLGGRDGLGDLTGLGDAGGLLGRLRSRTTLTARLALLALRLDDGVEGLVEGLHFAR